MSATDRQNRLLIAEDWKRIYQSYKNADFTSYDFENLRRVMINYIRENYPEDFNDYIESSEYLALIDMMAFLGQSFAFRVDLNARENFLELAERRESILRLSRTLSYNAKRNKTATGLLKWESISTTEDVIDGNGRNVSNQEIIWNDPSNPNWLDQFIRVVNAALPITAQFGSPNNSAQVIGIPSEQYRLQTLGTSVPVYGFSKAVDGRNMNFEVVSTIIKDGSITEEPPLAGRRLSFIYKDDGRGAGSVNSGFFTMFKQGTLNTGSFNLTQPVSNDIVDIDSTNINDTDVWLYKLNANGIESEYWERVPNLESNNIIYNSVKKNIKNIYNVITRTNDRISLAFGDGVFATIPFGSFRLYYRTSNGLTYTINPKDMRNVSVDLSYLSNTGQLEVLSISMSLQTSVANSSATESDEEVKVKAPATYYTQNRMITAEDYNISPLSVDQDVLKIKTINRTSSGISRYFDLIDPTGKYSNTILFSDDGVLYREEYEDSFRFSYRNKVDIQGIVLNKILPTLSEISIRNYYYLKFARKYIGNDFNITWTQKTQASNLSTGFLKDTNNSVIGYNINNNLKHLEIGALLKFVAPNGKMFLKTRNNQLVDFVANKENTSNYIWVKLIAINNNGLGLNNTGILEDGTGSISFNEKLPTGAILEEIIPKWRTNLTDNVVTIISELIFANKPFGLRYDIDTKSWQVIFEVNLNQIDNFSVTRTGDISNQKLDASWLLLFTSDLENYTVKVRKLRYIFESDRKIRFFFDKTNKVYDTKTNTVVKDLISILNINNKINIQQIYNYDIDWEITNELLGADGYTNSKKIELSFKDSNDDGIVDDPDIFNNTVAPTTSIGNVDFNNFVVLKRYETSTGQYDYSYVYNEREDGLAIVTVLENMNQVSSSLLKDGQYVFSFEESLLYRYNEIESKWELNFDYKVFQGRDKIKFQYVHSADYEARIDPGQTNLMDLYVLTKQYDVSFRQWLLGSISEEPMPPSTEQLNLILASSLNQIKAMSDEVVYHPIRFKVLFGAKAIPSLRASFKLIKNIEQTISDNDLKSKVLAAINEFFTLDNWDFGDSFYFSELVAYVMNRTAPFLVNILIVPRMETLEFGSLFEITAENDEIFINGATTDDLEIIESVTASALNAKMSTTNTNIVSQQYIISKAGLR